MLFLLRSSFEKRRVDFLSVIEFPSELFGEKSSSCHINNHRALLSASTGNVKSEHGWGGTRDEPSLSENRIANVSQVCSPNDQSAAVEKVKALSLWA